jgi:hypothetical protein
VQVKGDDGINGGQVYPWKIEGDLFRAQAGLVPLDDMLQTNAVTFDAHDIIRNALKIIDHRDRFDGEGRSHNRRLPTNLIGTSRLDPCSAVVLIVPLARRKKTLAS